jgi:hypothetical protein
MAKTTKTGRPAGSTNRPVTQIAHEPPRCRECHSTDLRVLRRLPDQDYAGTSPAGKPYTKIERRRVQCQNCAAVMFVMDYVNV